MLPRGDVRGRRLPRHVVEVVVLARQRLIDPSAPKRSPRCPQPARSRQRPASQQARLDVPSLDHRCRVSAPRRGTGDGDSRLRVYRPRLFGAAGFFAAVRPAALGPRDGLALVSAAVLRVRPAAFGVLRAETTSTFAVVRLRLLALLPLRVAIVSVSMIETRTCARLCLASTAARRRHQLRHASRTATRHRKPRALKTALLAMGLPAGKLDRAPVGVRDGDMGHASPLPAFAPVARTLYLTPLSERSFIDFGCRSLSLTSVLRCACAVSAGAT